MTVLAQLVVPPYAGSVTPRSTEIAGTRSTKVTSVCQELAAMPRLAFTLSTRALPVFTVGWAVVSGPRSSAKAIWCVVVEVVLAAEEEHLVLQQRRAHLRHDVRVQVAAEADALDHGADPAADLAHAHGGGRGDGGRDVLGVCVEVDRHGRAPLARSGVSCG